MPPDPDAQRKRRCVGPLISHLVWPCLVMSLSATGCSEPSGPGEGAPVMPELTDLSASYEDTGLPHGGVLIIEGAPADTSFRLKRAQRAPVEIEVTSGDREEVGLYRRLCAPRERDWPFHCFSFLALTREGTHVTDLADDVAANRGRLTTVIATGDGGVIKVLDPEDLLRTARRAESWPGVQPVSLNYLACVESTPVCLAGVGSRLHLPVPVDTGAAVPGDGIVQIRPGDTITVTYRHPGGGRLEAKQVVP